MAEVVRQARSSVGAFYSRFKDKDGLLYALYERYLEQAVATADDALQPQRWDSASVTEILSSVVYFLVEIYRQRAGLMRAFVLRNQTDPEFRARQERLSHYVSGRISALLLARRREISHPDPEKATVFGLGMVFSTIESAILFGETRSRALSLSDAELSVELTRSLLAYLGVLPAPAHPDPVRIP